MQAMLSLSQPSASSCLRQLGRARPQAAFTSTRCTAFRSGAGQAQRQSGQPHSSSTLVRHTNRGALVCRAGNDRQSGGGGVSLASKFNPVYVGITGAFAALFLFRNPYIFAVLTIATVLPQNSNVTSLNNLVLLFYESGLFMNFAEAVYCVRLVTWLSMICMVFSFAIFQ